MEDETEDRECTEWLRGDASDLPCCWCCRI